jgi:hypothetical protein
MIERRIEHNSPDLRPLSAFIDFRRKHKDSQALPRNPNKVAFEMGATGLMMIGLLGSASRKDVIIRPIDPKLHQSPDCEVIDAVTETILHKVEVVHFTEYSHKQGILKFLLKTKLSPVYAYPDEVALLCHWLGVQEEVNWERLHRKIVTICPHRNFFILVRTNKLSMDYQLVQIAPKLEIYTFQLLNYMLYSYF